MLADEGHLAIDDLDKMHENDRVALNEPMEEETVTASKGDANEALSARTSITAAANPENGRFSDYEPIAEQVDLGPGLISRFDLIFTRADEPDADRDAEIATHLLQVSYAGELQTQAEHSEGERGPTRPSTKSSPKSTFHFSGSISRTHAEIAILH